MFDIGWTEMAVIALLALIVIGPKDLPKVLRTAGQWMRKARGLTREFQSGLDDMIREAELDDAKKAVETGRNFNIKKAVQDSVDPTGELEKEGKSIEDSAKSGLREDASQSQSATAGTAPGQTTGTAKGATQETAKTPPKSAAAAKDDGETEKRATVIKHPYQQAPGNSVKPPAEEAAAPAPKTPSGGDVKTETAAAPAKPAPKESNG